MYKDKRKKSMKKDTYIKHMIHKIISNFKREQSFINFYKKFINFPINFLQNIINAGTTNYHIYYFFHGQTMNYLKMILYKITNVIISNRLSKFFQYN